MSLEPVAARQAAEERRDRIRAGLVTLWDDIKAAWRERDWLALGYKSWDDMCDAEYRIGLVLPKDERPAIHAELRAEGMSTRAIAAATGVSVGTVHSDLAGVQDRTPAPVTGMDGKTYQPTQPTRVIEPEIVDAEVIDDEPPVLTSQQWMAREGYVDEPEPRRRTDAEREALRAKSKADAIRQRNLDLNVGFSTISELAHPHILDEVLQNWQPLSTDWTPAMLHDLADLLHQIADRWKATA